MKKEFLDELASFGIDMVWTPFECQFYGFDVTPLPKETSWVFRGTTPDAVLRPKNTEEVARVMDFANKHKIPVCPRGGGTSGYYQSVPRNKGIVIETLALNNIGELDEKEGVISVSGGVIWSQLDWELKKKGWTLKTYPTSYKSSTVAGWIQTEGLGVGSLAFGSIKKLIKEIEVVLPSGEVVWVPNEGLVETKSGNLKFEDFIKSEGMMGIITSVKLEVRRLPESIATYLLKFKDKNDFALASSRLANISSAYFIEFVNGSYMDLLAQSGHHTPKHLKEEVFAVIRLEGGKSDVEKGDKEIAALLAEYPEIARLPQEEAEEEYSYRLKYFRIKNAYSSVTPADLSVPLSNLGQYLDKVSHFRFEFAYKGEILTKEQCGLMFFYVLANELSLVRFMSAAPYQMEFILSAMKMGGSPNGGIGLLNTPYVFGLRTQSEREAFIQKKETFDQNWIMNPGKWTDPPFFLRPSIYFSGMKLLEPVCWLVGGIVGRW